MKKFFLIMFLSVVMSEYVNAYDQHTHVNITKEAYQLLKIGLGRDIPIMQAHLGDFPIGLGPWQTGLITNGAWREDEEDVVYHYSVYNPPTITGIIPNSFTETMIIRAIPIIGEPDPFVSITHFWEADNGDNIPTTMHGGLRITGIDVTFDMTIPNSYQKMVYYANGGWNVRVQLILYGFPTQSDGSGFCATQWAWVNFKYNSLIDLYTNKNIWVTKVEWLTGQVTTYNSPIRFQKRHWSSLNSYSYSDFFDHLSWEILGRMCHLLQDISVPAHAHIDMHGSDNDLIRQDSYERSFGELHWTAEQVNNLVGGFIDPTNESNPIHYLMYITQQMADHFGSNGPYNGFGNDNFDGNPNADELYFLSAMDVPNLGEPIGETNPLSNSQIKNVRDIMIPQAVRATAGLLYWFAKESGILPPERNISFKNHFVNAGNGGVLYVNNQSVNSPTHTYSVLEGSTINATAPTQILESIIYHFAHWEDGNESSSRTFTVAGDQVHTAYYIGTPLMVTNLHFNRYNPRIQQYITLYWDEHPNEGVTKYEIIRYKKGQPELHIGTVNRGTTTFVDYDYRLASSYSGDELKYGVKACYTPEQTYSIAMKSVMGEGTAINKSAIEDSLSQPLSAENVETLLSNNYPNPFNPSTEIVYQIPTDGVVSIIVYNALGEKVAVLLDEFKVKGKYSIIFNASNLPSGTYFYNIQVGEYSEVNKMLLLK